LNQNIILFDFEYTAWQGSKARRWSGPGEHREIIQIAALRVAGKAATAGAAAADSALAETASFDRLVKPKHNPILSPYITALTGIEQAAVDLRGQSFAEVFADFYAFCEQGCLPCFCYGDDVSVLQENFVLNNLPFARFPAGIFDIRATFEQAGIDTHPYTSGTVYQALGVEFEHAAHNALNDVRSLALTLQELLRLGRMESSWLEAGQARGKFL
jgi:inhibitor of KinA sporulation pathway (predicted exonuclease)